MEITNGFNVKSYTNNTTAGKMNTALVENPFTIFGNVGNANSIEDKAAPVAANASFQHPDVEKRLQENGWDFGTLDYNQFGGIPLMIPPDATITKEAIRFPPWYIEELGKTMAALHGEDVEISQVREGVAQALHTGEQTIYVVASQNGIDYKGQLPKLFAEELRLYDVLKEKTGYDYPALKEYLAYRKNLLDLIQKQVAATEDVSVAYYSNSTATKGNYADRVDFQNEVVKLQRAGKLGENGKPVDSLTAEQIDYLKGKYNPHQPLFLNDMYEQRMSLYKELTEFGIITAEESLLSMHGSNTSISSWSYSPALGWTGNRRNDGQLRTGSFATFMQDNTVSQIQWLEGALKIDKDNPRSDDTTAARKKIYEVLIGIFGVPAQAQTFDAYIAGKAHQTQIL